MSSAHKTIKEMLAEKRRRRRRVYRRRPLTTSERLAYYGVPILPSSVIEEKEEPEFQKCIALSELSKASHNISPSADASALDTFDQTKKTTTPKIDINKNNGKRAHSVTPPQSTIFSFSSAADSDKLNENCVQQCETPVTTRVASKRFASNSLPAEPRADSNENLSLQNQSTSKENILQTRC